MRRVLWGLLLAWATGCTCGRAPGLDRPYACQQDVDCADGFTCADGQCVQVDGGQPDGGQPDGGQPDGGQPDAGCVPSGPELCNDGVDNNCDGLIDCQDPKCTDKACDPTHPAAVCCGTGSNSSVCKDLSQDSANCGGCGVSCAAGKSCTPVSIGSIFSGACNCSTKGNPCQGNGTCASLSGASTTVCACTLSSQCGGGTTCTAAQGLGSPGFCYYP